MDQVGMSIYKSRQRHASAQIDLLRRPRLRQLFHLRPRSHGRDQSIAHQQPATFDQSQVGKGIAPPRTVPAQSQQLRGAADEKGIRQGFRIMPKTKPAGQALALPVGECQALVEFGLRRYALVACPR